MFRSIRKYTPLLKRIFFCFFAFLFLFCCVTRPIQVSAEAVTITIGIAGAAVEVVAPLLVIVLILIGCGYVYNNAEELLDKAQDLYDTASTSLKNWYDNIAEQIIDGSSAFKIPSTYRNEINNQLDDDNKKLPENMPYLIIPSYLDSVDTLSQSEIFSSDVLSAMEENNELTEETNSLLNRIRVYMGSLATNLQSSISSSTSTIRNYLRLMKADFADRLQDIRYMQTTINNNISERLQGIREMMTTVNNNISERLQGIREMMTTVNNNISERLQSIRTMQSTINSNITDRLSDIYTKLKNGFSSLQESLERIEEKLSDMTDVETVTKPQIEVQAGAQTIVVSDYATMGQAFSAKMGWVPQIFDFLSELRDRLDSGTAPKIAIDLSEVESSYNWGGIVYVLDMTWYSRYKPIVDPILSGIMWICFGWAIYKRIPDILSGVGLTVENATETRGHVWSDRAERSESLSYRQQRREEYYKKHGRR